MTPTHTSTSTKSTDSKLSDRQQSDLGQPSHSHEQSGLGGEPGTAQRWLAASLDKTLRLQLSPPEDARVISALLSPDSLSPVM